MSNCIFCKILSGAIPCTKVYEDEFVLGFKDLHPQAKVHVLFIHKNHSANINEMIQEPQSVSDIFKAIKECSIQKNWTKDGFRVVTNLGTHAGQTVFHTHFHVLSGEPLGSFGR